MMLLRRTFGVERIHVDGCVGHGYAATAGRETRYYSRARGGASDHVELSDSDTPEGLKAANTRTHRA